MWYMGQASRVIPREIRAVIYTFFGFLGNEKYRKESLRKRDANITYLSSI
jgi:hypothetical protein